MQQNSKRTIDTIVGSQLREKRLKRGMTLSDVARKIGVSYQQVQKYELAQSKISASNLYKLSALYEVNVERFFDGLNDSENSDIALPVRRSKNSAINLLMIENDPGDEVIIKKILSGFKNLNVLCVHDETQTMEVLRYKTLFTNFSKPDLIFLDVHLDKSDGIDIIRKIKMDRDLQDIQIIVITNSIDNRIMRSAYLYGASGYICKSFEFGSFKGSLITCIKYWTTAVILPSIGK
ncbi:MAG: helix-turn-helix domain-containing protein [Holosporales bacterium]|jgi:transcriptional regulator with XRE-family HTH domain|nr:helix-turn-helix domain-containing protein [Holosporales bacterium]